MRVPLSWLKEFTPLDVDADRRASVARARASPRRARPRRRGDRARRRRRSPASSLARVLEIDAIEGADRVRQVLVDAGGGRAARDRLRRDELRGRRRRAARHGRRRAARRDGASPAEDARRRPRTGCSARAASSGSHEDASGLLILASPAARRPLPRRDRARPPARRAPRDRARRRLRPRHRAEPARLPLDRRDRPRPRRRARAALRDPAVAAGGRRSEPPASSPRSPSGAVGLRPARRPGPLRLLSGCLARPRAPAADARRDAADQRRSSTPRTT